MNPGKLNKRIEVWGKNKFQNELLETDYVDKKIKSIWGCLLPQTGRAKRGQVDTISSNTTIKLIVRYSSGKDISEDMWIIYMGHRFDIDYILNPYFKNETLEIYCTEVVE
jgi:SPP1 family predicted phage head-tail adaptor